MKILSIGDVHGKRFWESVNPSCYDLIIFHGDYTDTPNFTTKQQIDNFENIVGFANDNKDKVKLLIGNHDIQYFWWHTEYSKLLRCTGRRTNLTFHMNRIYQENISLFAPTFQIKKYMWSHAGLTNIAYHRYYKRRIEALMEWDTFRNATLSDMINYLYKIKDPSIIWIGFYRNDEPGTYGSILWADARETWVDAFTGLHQIVGHTQMSQITRRHIDDNTSVTYVDVQDNFMSDDYKFAYDFPFYEMEL